MVLSQSPPKEQSAALLDTCKGVSSLNPNDKFDDGFKSQVELYLWHHRSDFDAKASSDEAYNQAFTAKELSSVLKILNDSAPGPDLINNWFLTNARPKLEASLLTLANTSLATGTVP